MANFNYTISIKCVNGVDTWVEFNFKNYIGDLSTDITNITVTGPSGFTASLLSNFVFRDDKQYILRQFNGISPPLGSYTFSITIGGETVEYVETQTINRSIPAVDTQTMFPSAGAIVPTSTTFTWDEVADPGYDIYYGIQIYDQNDYVVNERYVGNFNYNVNLVPGNYTWQVITMDGMDWNSSNNRTHGNWVNFTIV